MTTQPPTGDRHSELRPQRQSNAQRCQRSSAQRTQRRTGLSDFCRDVVTAPMDLDRLLRPDFPQRAEPPAPRDRIPSSAPGAISGLPETPSRPPGSWRRLSRARRIDPADYVPKEVVPDEILTRQNADRGRPHPIPNRPPPEPASDTDPLEDVHTWDVRDRLRECGTCGGLFLANRYNHRFCSRRCAWQSRLHIGVCPVCGVEFIAERPEQVCCSIGCGAASRRSDEYYRVCARCGDPFRHRRRA